MASANSEQNSSTNSLRLVIKSANQKYEDFVVDNLDQDWTIKRLKQHLSDNYPRNPEIESIRLIYSGKLLHDHCKLKEVLRQNSEVTSHIIHLVQSSANLAKLNQSSSSRANNTTSTTSTDDNEIDLDNELTPNSSSLSSSSESSSSSSSNSSPIPSLNATHARSSNSPYVSSNTFSQIQNDLNDLYHQQQQQRRQEQSNLTPKEKFNLLHENYIRYYESHGIPVQSNAWYSTYVQHMALYNYMYSNYLQALEQTHNETPIVYASRNAQAQTSSERSQEQPAAPPQPAPQAQRAPPPQPAQQPQQQPNRARAAPANPDAAEREDDWLSLLHNVVSFLVLFSIIYYYSSMERFLVIFTIVLILILYHNGWLSLQRRQVRNNVRVNNNRREDEQRAQNNLNENNRNENENRQQQQQQQENETAHPLEPPANPSMFRLIATFVITFFTSLIPERPRVAAN